jgi:hypothetical protein
LWLLYNSHSFNDIGAITMATQKLLEYHQHQLLLMVKAINPKHPLGDGFAAQLKFHVDKIEQLQK